MTEIAEGRGFTKAEIDKQKKIVENAYKTMDSHATILTEKIIKTQLVFMKKKRKS